MKKFFVFVALLVCFISGCSCGVERTSIYSFPIMAFSSKDDNYYGYTDPFGSYVSIVGYDKDDVEDLEEKLNDLVFKYHSLLDSNYYYKNTNGSIINNIKIINDSYGSGQAIQVDDIIIDILKEGIKYTKLSNGKFNIFSGKLVDTWDPRFSVLSGSLYKQDPTEQQINDALACIPSVSEIDSVLVINEENNTVMFNSFDGCQSGASITLGAMAKSYFIDRLNEDDDVKDLDDYILDAGKSSIIVEGNNPTRDGGAYYIGVANSFTEQKGDNSVQLQLVDDCAVSTSSGDEKGYVNEDGTRRHHIIDATSGYPNTYLLATTVVADNAMIADIITTTLMTMESINEIKNYLAQLQNDGINVKVLFQVNENGNLKIYANRSMKDIICQVYGDIVVEEFSYGAQA